jgi:hypothetical protein
MNAKLLNKVSSGSFVQNEYLKILELAPFIETIGVRCKVIKVSKLISDSSFKMYEIAKSFTLLVAQRKIKSHRLVVTPLQSYFIVEYP